MLLFNFKNLYGYFTNDGNDSLNQATCHVFNEKKVKIAVHITHTG